MRQPVRTTQATAEERQACTCDKCGRVLNRRGWLYPQLHAEVREVTGGVTCGRCLSAK